MAAPRLAAAVIALGACAAAFGQYGANRSVVPVAGPVSDIPTLPVPPVAELPPFLTVPQAPVAPRRPCHPCPNEYDPYHVYLPDQSPDYCGGGCDGECGPCRREWFSAAFYFGCLKDLGDVNRGFAYGVRLGGGYWFSDDKTVGLDLSMFNTHDTYREVVFGGPIVTSPVTVTTGDANLRGELLTYEKVRVDGLVGYRYLQLHEKLTVFAPTFLSDVAARNEVHAGQVGLVADYQIGSYFAEVMGKLAIGRNSDSVTVNGVRGTGGVTCMIPELGVRFGYQLGEGCWGTLGYTFLYASNVERPGRGETDFFLHGLLIGIESRF